MFGVEFSGFFAGGAEHKAVPLRSLPEQLTSVSSVYLLLLPLTVVT